MTGADGGRAAEAPSGPEGGAASRVRSRAARSGGASASRADGLLILLGVLALAAALRAVRLDAGLWFDELVTLIEYARLSPAEIATTYAELNNHVAFSLLASLSLGAFGESAWALRLPAALLGVGSIAALWWLARRVGRLQEAALASLLLAVSYHHVWFSQNARGYTGLLLLTLLGTGLFLEGMRRRVRGLWAAYAAVLALALYTHLSGVFAFASHGVAWLFLLARARLRPARAADWPGAAGAWPLAGFALGGGLTLLLYAPMLPQMLAAFGAQSAAEGGNVKVDAWTDPLWTALEVLRGLQLGFASAAGALLVGGLALAGWLRTARRDPLFAAVIVLPVPLTLGAVLALSFHFWPRYFFVLFGFGALLLVRGAFVVAETGARWAGAGASAGRRAGVALCGLLVAASAFSLGANFRHPKQDYAGARAWVEAQREPDEPVIALGLAAYAYGRYYAPDWRSAATPAELEALLRGAPGAWVVYSFPAHLRAAAPELLERIERDFERVRTFPGTLGGGDIEVLHAALRSPAAGRAQGAGSDARERAGAASPTASPGALTGDGARDG